MSTHSLKVSAKYPPRDRRSREQVSPQPAPARALPSVGRGGGGGAVCRAGAAPGSRNRRATWGKERRVNEAFRCALGAWNSRGRKGGGTGGRRTSLGTPLGDGGRGVSPTRRGQRRPCHTCAPPRRPQTAILRGPPAGPAARVLDSPHTAVSSSTASRGQSQGHKCTCSRCTLQWLLVYLQSYANITII